MELRRWPKISSEDLLASKEALSRAKELRRERVVLTDCAPDCTLSMLGLCCLLSGTAQASQASYTRIANNAPTKRAEYKPVSIDEEP